MRERAAALGGQLSVASAPGHGTTVTVTLPVADEVRRQSEAIGDGQEASGKR